MIEREISNLLRREPFQPFRVKLVNGDAHDVGDPGLVAFLEEGLYVLSAGGYWAEFPFDRIASLESLVLLPSE